MNEYVAYLIIYLAFAFISFIFYKLSVTAKSFLAFLIGLCYLVIIYWLIEFFNQFHQYLRDKGIYIEFGHASLGLILMMLFCYGNALIVIFFTLYKRQRKRQTGNDN